MRISALRIHSLQGWSDALLPAPGATWNAAPVDRVRLSTVQVHSPGRQQIAPVRESAWRVPILPRNQLFVRASPETCLTVRESALWHRSGHGAKAPAIYATQPL